MKNSRLLTSIIAAIIGGIISFAFTNNIALATIISIPIFIIVFILSQNIYIKAFWAVMALIITLNKVYFEFIGSISNNYFKIGANEVPSSVTIALIILAFACLLFYFLERNRKLEGTIFSIKKNKVGDITGNNNTVNQF